MKKFGFALWVQLIVCHLGWAQSIHYSQYFNAPLLVNPANTGMMPEYDYRIGANYRNQWQVIPVPYNTFSGFGDFKVGGNNENKVSNHWLGIGFAYYYDVAGSGNLSLTQLQASLAYHLQTSQFTMISLGFSGSTVQNSVNYDLLTFDEQWDGFTFNSQLPNAEKGGMAQTGYKTVAAGINFSWFPSEAVYINLGGSAANINKPVESFYAGKNTIDMRESGVLDMFFKVSPAFTINPSAYYTTQSAAAQVVVGTLTRTNLNGPYQPVATQLILGGFTRLGDAIIGVIGFQYANVQFVANYDMTISSLAPYNNSYGATEFSLIYQGLYGKNKDKIKKMMGCPRFF